MQMHFKISRVTGPKFTKCVAVVICFSSTVLTQQSALRSVHPLSNNSGDIKKRKQHEQNELAGGIAMRANYLTFDMGGEYCIQHVCITDVREQIFVPIPSYFNDFIPI